MTSNSPKHGHASPRKWLGYALVSLTVFAAGCPHIRLTAAEIKPESISGGRFTLSGEVTVYGEDDEDEPEDWYTRGLIAVWVPAGWKVHEARLRPPTSEQLEALVDVPESIYLQGRRHHERGEWYAFVTECERVPREVVVYGLEVDIETPPDTTSGTLGFLLEPWEEDDRDYSDEPVADVTVDIAAGTVTVDSLPVNIAKDAELESCPMPEPVDRGPRGCSCHAAGARASGDWSLLRLLTAVASI